MGGPGRPWARFGAVLCPIGGSGSFFPVWALAQGSRCPVGALLLPPGVDAPQVGGLHYLTKIVFFAFSSFCGHVKYAKRLRFFPAFGLLMASRTSGICKTAAVPSCFSPSQCFSNTWNLQNGCGPIVFFAFPWLLEHLEFAKRLRSYSVIRLPMAFRTPGIGKTAGIL